MPYTPPDIKDAPDASTPLNQANIEAWLATAANYSFARVVVGGNLGATFTLNLNSDQNVWLTGTLTANCTITITGRTAGARFNLLLEQDATGGRTLAISDGTTSQPVTVPTDPASTMAVGGYCPNTTDIWIAPTTSGGSTGGLTQAYQTVQDEGAAVTQQSVLNFIGAGVTATNNAGASRTDVTIPGGSGGLTQAYQTVQDEGVALTQQSIVNFIGPSITATDNAGAGRTDVMVRVQAERKRVLWSPNGLIDDTTIGGGRAAGFSNITALTSGTLRLVGGAVIPAGVTVTTISFFSGNTAAGTPLNQWFCLVRQSDLAVLAKTQDATTAAWVAGTVKTLSLATGSGGTGVYTAPAETAVYVGILENATTVPSVTGYTLFTSDISLASPQFGGNSTTGLTNPASLGATAAALSGTAVIAMPYAQLF